MQLYLTSEACCFANFFALFSEEDICQKFSVDHSEPFSRLNESSFISEERQTFASFWPEGHSLLPFYYERLLL